MEIEIKKGDKKPAKEIALPSGTKVQIFEGKAKDLLAAKRGSKGADGKMDEDKMMLSLMSQLCKFNGEALPPEAIEDMGIKDFTELMANFADFLS